MGVYSASDPAFICRVLASVKAYVSTGHVTERDVVLSFLQQHAFGYLDAAIPMSEEDTIVEEMAFKYGRADLVIFHADGSASVIEVKDGTKGYSHVVGGIGQASLYATQLMMAKSVRSVRRCLLWSSTGSQELDAVIGEACERAAVIPLCRASARSMVDAGRQVLSATGSN